MAEYIWSAPSEYANDVSDLNMDHTITTPYHMDHMTRLHFYAFNVLVGLG